MARTMKARNSLGWLFLTLSVPILMIDILLVGKSVKDAWILDDILPAFIVFGLLLRLSPVPFRSGVDTHVTCNAADSSRRWKAILVSDYACHFGFGWQVYANRPLFSLFFHS